MRRTLCLRRVPRPTVDLARLVPIFDRLGLAGATWPTAPLVAAPQAKAKRATAAAEQSSSQPPTLAPVDALAPLFTAHFAFEDRHLTALGDAFIRRHLATCVQRWVLYRGLAVSPATVRQLVACFHNAMAMRFLAERLGLMELANFETRDIVAASDTDPLSLVSQLREPPIGPSTKDVAGTSFAVSKGPGTSAVWGPRLSHLVGAIRTHLGDDAAAKAVESMWGLAPSSAELENVPHRAAQFVSELVDAYDAPRVVASILTAQGLVPSFSSRQVPVPVARHPAASNAAADTEEGKAGAAGPLDDALDQVVSKEDAAAEEAEQAVQDAVRELAHSSEEDAPTALAAAREATSVALEGQAGPMPSVPPALRTALAPNDALQSLAAGPGAIDLIDKFAKRNPATASVVRVTDGWLSEEDAQSESQRGQVRFGSAARGDAFFADLVAMPPPKQDGYVAQAGGDLKRVEDAEYFAAAANKDGISVETEMGMNVADYVRSFRPGGASRVPRVFEVTLHLAAGDGSEPRVASRSVGRRYTAARSATASGYLEGVLLDLMRMSASAKSEDAPGSEKI